MDQEKLDDIFEAGTGFMLSLTEAIKHLASKGYTENLTLKVDHFESSSGQHIIYPEDFVVDKMIRFENTSDPDDQSILYAICAPKLGIKGIYVESYGLYHEELSPSMIQALRTKLQ